MKRFFTLLVLVFCASSILAQVNLNKGEIKQKNYLQIIPYEKIGSRMIIPVTINGKVYKFILDTGAPLVISHKLYEELNLQIIGETKISDATGARKEMYNILLPELSIQGISFVNTPGFIVQESSTLMECLGIDGLIGSNMLRNSVVQFDDQSRHITITNDIKNLTTKNAIKQKMKLSRIQSNPYITIYNQKGDIKLSNRVLLDTGADSFYEISIFTYHNMKGRHDVFNKIAEADGSLSLGVHEITQKQRHLLLNIPELVVSKTSFNNVVINTTYAFSSRIGSKLLQYGIATLDYKKKSFYFQPFDNMNTEALSESPLQISFTINNNKKIIVGIIWDKALESQVNLGDELLSVDGFDLQQMDECELVVSRNYFSNQSMMEVELRDIISGKIKKVYIKRL